MAETNWFYVTASLIGGGAMGAVINSFVTLRRERLQRIGYRIELQPVFRRTSGKGTSLSAQIAITHDGLIQTFNNLFLIELQVINRGSKDMSEFDFGVTLEKGDQCLYVEASPPNRHHQILHALPVTPQAPSSEIDFKLKPFNRRDSYSFKLYMVIPEGREEPGKIKLGSANPIEFVVMPTAGELLAKAATEMVLNMGPFRIGLMR